MHLDSVDPALVAGVDLRLSSLQVEASDDRVATCHEYLIFVNFEAFDGFLACNETLHDLVLLEVDAAHHLIPARGEQHVVLLAHAAATDGVCELEDGHADGGVEVPLAHRAIIRCRYKIIRRRRKDGIDSVCVPNEWRQELVARREGADQAVLVARVNFVIHETEAGDETVVALTLHGARRLEHLLRSVVDNLHLMILVLEELMVLRALHINPLRQLLLLQVPNCKQKNETLKRLRVNELNGI